MGPFALHCSIPSAGGSYLCKQQRHHRVGGQRAVLRLDRQGDRQVHLAPHPRLPLRQAQRHRAADPLTRPPSEVWLVRSAAGEEAAQIRIREDARSQPPGGSCQPGNRSSPARCPLRRCVPAPGLREGGGGPFRRCPRLLRTRLRELASATPTQGVEVTGALVGGLPSARQTAPSTRKGQGSRWGSGRRHSAAGDAPDLEEAVGLEGLEARGGDTERGGDGVTPSRVPTDDEAQRPAAGAGGGADHGARRPRAPAHPQATRSTRPPSPRSTGRGCRRRRRSHVVERGGRRFGRVEVASRPLGGSRSRGSGAAPERSSRLTAPCQ